MGATISPDVLIRTLVPLRGGTAAFGCTNCAGERRGLSDVLIRERVYSRASAFVRTRRDFFAMGRFVLLVCQLSGDDDAVCVNAVRVA